ncbi:MAG: NAD(P)/FAD-dependent oxidoreductase [Cyclobacteriaceae bacterium]
MKGVFDVLVVGGGAAGFFTAINIAEKNKHLKIAILEKSNKLLSKVKISGGGRCNVTNQRDSPSELTKFYPRGEKKLYPVFKHFGTKEMREWLENHGVKVKSENDHRVFPISDSSQTIIDCFLNLARKFKVDIFQKVSITDILSVDELWKISTHNEVYHAKKLVIATGSSPSFWNTLHDNLGLKIAPPVPSLFTFNIKDSRIHGLEGIAFKNCTIKVVGSKIQEEGPLLLTHWGMSGPAILKMSARGALDLAKVNYQFNVMINYTGESYQQVQSHLLDVKEKHPKKQVHNLSLFDIPKRFWIRLCKYCEINNDEIFAELSKKQMNRLVEELAQGLYEVNGKSTFKEEFVTAGGVLLEEIDLNTYECKRFPNLYLAGEVLNIDALTGGFNFQACWSAGWIISESITSK